MHYIVRRFVKKLVRLAGFDLVRYYPGRPSRSDEWLADLTPEEMKIVESIKWKTLTSPSRVAALIGAIHYITGHGVSGDLVECGVWRGGSMMAAAQALALDGDTHRHLYLYDTYEKMPPGTEADRNFYGTAGTGGGVTASLQEVRANVLATGYPKEQIHFVKGMVEETIPKVMPLQICLLRLDTDFYESTKHELRHLFPLLQPGGVLIIDDYGHWKGSGEATDEYFRENGLDLYLHRVDYSCRLAVVPFDRKCK
jgi:O-methyltransferase